MEGLKADRDNKIIHNKDQNSLQVLFDDDEVEIRPARRRDAVEAGLDYWIDEADFERERQRKLAARNRKVAMKAEAGSMSRRRLREEVVAPYKQNWIGLLSAGIVALSVIGTQFPELLQTPVIPIPDL